jgi:hypothetical protein
MTISSVQSERHYYDTFPAGPFQTGDIWSNIPSNGLLEASVTFGLLITPACDLQNRKSDTLAFMPIVSVREAMKSRFMIRKFSSELKQDIDQLFPDLSDVCDFGDADFLTEISNRLSVDSPDLRNKTKPCERLNAWLSFLRMNEVPSDLGLPFLKPKYRDDIFRTIIKNSFSHDIHFFPRQRLDPIPAFREHSVCLFRYIQTFPVEIFELANRSSETVWHKSLTATSPFFASRFNDLPVRVLRLKHDICVDLITRFTSLYNRIGSADFTDICIEDFLKELGQ